MTSPMEAVSDHRVVTEDEENMPELIWNPTGPVSAAEPQPPAPAESADLDAVGVDSAAAESGSADGPDADTPAAVSVPVAEPELTPASPVASDTTGSSAHWHEVLAIFVDDPRSSTEQAAALVGDSVELLVKSVRERQHSLLSTWQAEDAGTEEMRTAVQHYRTFWDRLEVFSREA